MNLDKAGRYGGELMPVQARREEGWRCVCVGGVMKEKFPVDAWPDWDQG